MKDNEIKLPSGAILTIGLAPFADAKEIYQVASKHLVNINLDPRMELDVNFYKNIACTLLGCKEFEQAIHKCLIKCQYDGVKFDDDTFEEEKAREDYLEVLFNVAKKNIEPFTKTLMEKYSDIIKQIVSASQK